MKKSLSITAIVFLFSVLMISCSKDDDNSSDNNNNTPNPPANNAPDVPSNPVPQDAAIDQALQLTLNWDCSDPDQDPLTYDVYFATGNPPATKVLEGTSNASYSTAQLQYNTTYFWKVIAMDDEGLTTAGPVWQFTTEEEIIVFQCGDDFTDPRDGKIYQTAQFGNLCWMKQNLDHGDMIQTSGEQTNNGLAEKYCYDDDPANCATYGGLYQWNELMQYSKGDDLCPAGWHTATFDDWKDLEMSLGMTAQDAGQFSGWVGTDQGTQLQESTGFGALLGGYVSKAGVSTALGFAGRYWTSTEENSYNAYSRELQSGNGQVRHDKWDKDLGYYVRCVMD